MAYNADLAAATAGGMLIWSIVLAIILILYGNFKLREGDSTAGIVAIGSAIFILFINWATDYYKAVWIGGALLGISILMYFTAADEGILQPLLFWTGAGLILVSIMGYFAPITLNADTNAFILGVGIIGLVMLVDVNIDRYAHSWELFLIFGLAIMGSALAIFTFGVDHAWYGLGMMYAALGLALCGIYTKVVDPLFMAGFIIFLDDFLGHETVDPKPDLTPIWFLLGFIGTSIYLIWRWKDEIS
ncbi:hypothetical protein [Archaeoglobus profundus]|uniref:DUF4203 domain-containing protein n=1 Tax=Archaeoglobus profundus (strain DSM 5631 / JCM 9629 / NBRC 100127 / Av18) TaxID=572546 RepID=D2RHZ2_ARCPA|nr:hypothetical protein [Archaeoglobus profundus]ADB57917.1 hypothetical protein Arcpr_0854 [Archaeoglobus profundus DSM 5631]